MSKRGYVNDIPSFYFSVGIAEVLFNYILKNPGDDAVAKSVRVKVQRQ